MTRLVRRLLADEDGSMVIETAIIAPLLVLMSLGGFEVSHMISRQHELQSGAAEATAVALAANMGAETDTVKLASLLRGTLRLSEQQVVVTKMYRCESSSTYVDTITACDGNGGGGTVDPKKYSTYVRVNLTDTYHPIWSRLGLGGSFTYHVNRTIELS